MSSIVALNAGSIKIKNMSTYGQSSSLNIGSNINISGNITVGDELLVLSSEQSASSTTGGIIVKGGLGVKMNVNIGGNLNVGSGALYVNRNGNILTTKIGIGTTTPRCSLDIIGTDGIIVPSGTNVDRDNISNPVNGMIRYNNQDNFFEGYSNNTWAILGGAKISSKIPILKNIIKIADDIIIGGGMSFTFAKALGGKIGNSIHEDSMLDEVNEIMKIAENNNVKIHTPIDVVCAKEFDNNSPVKVFDIMNIHEDYEGMDAGPKSLLKFKEVVLNSKTILWNGPLGVFEFSNFSKGTKELGKYISESTQNGAFSLVGGGDSVAAVKIFKMQKNMSYVSTGGGAMLESLEGKNLPGINALLK